MPRLLIITDDFPIFSQTFVVGHLKGMEERGWDVRVVCDQVDEEKLGIVFGNEAPHVYEMSEISDSYTYKSRWVRRIIFYLQISLLYRKFVAPMLSNRARRKILVLKRIIHDWRPDVIHAQFGPLGLLAAPVSSQSGIPLLVNFRGYDFTSWPLTHGWAQYSCFPKNAAAVCHTKFCFDVLRGNLNIPVKFVRRGVDRKLFWSKGRVNKWPDKIKLIVAGRLVYKKGAHLAVDALAILRKLDPDKYFELVVVGGGEGADSIHFRAEVLGISSRVQVIGEASHEEIAEHMRCADIQLIPSLPGSDGWVENFCTVASEGLASGLCVIGANIGGIPDAVEGVGIVVPVGSPFELARGVIAAIEQKSPLEWSEAAIRKAETYCDEFMMDDYEAVTKEAIVQSHG